MLAWDDIRIFHAIASCQSISKAAHNLELSQPQVSRRLKSMEDQLGLRLFERNPTGLRLTRAGLDLLEPAQVMARDAERIARLIPSLSNQGKRRVRIAVDEIREAFLAPHFAHLMAMAPDVDLELYSHHKELSQSLREADLQIRSWFPKKGPLKTRKLGEMAFGIFAGKDYWLKCKEMGKTDIYSQCDWIGFAPDNLWFPDEKRWLDKNLKVKPRFLCNTATSILHATEAGNGLAILPVFLGQRSPLLTQLDIPVPELCFPEYLIVHEDLIKDPTIRTMIDALVTLYQNHDTFLNPSPR